MSKFPNDRSLQELDPVKMLLFFLAFLAISFIIIFAFIVPNIKEYKEVKALHNRNEMATIRLENTLNAKEDQLRKIVKNNQKLLDALITTFDEKKFIIYTNKFFTHVSLAKNSNQKSHKGFLVYELNVTSSLQTPQNFYDFLDGLKTYENIIKADFPIQLTANGDIIQSSFNIKVYNLKDSK